MTLDALKELIANDEGETVHTARRTRTARS